MQRLCSYITSILLLASPAWGESVSVEHSAVAQAAERLVQFLSPILQTADADDISGYYQGEFDLKEIGAFSTFNCSATDSYLSEFFVRQRGRNVSLETPGGATFTGRRLRKGNGRFRVRTVVKENGFRRRLKIRGRLLDPYTVRVVSVERVFSGKQEACKFKHRATMIRFWN